MLITIHLAALPPQAYRLCTVYMVYRMCECCCVVLCAGVDGRAVESSGSQSFTAAAPESDLRPPAGTRRTESGNVPVLLLWSLCRLVSFG